MQTQYNIFYLSLNNKTMITSKIKNYTILILFILVLISSIVAFIFIKRFRIEQDEYSNLYNNFDALNEVWDSWFSEGTAPSRACVKAEIVNPKLLVEMTFTAAAGEKYK